ncbi:PREDICTED: G/T mismatch-specific thymine DNA glycosylase-like [Eufriesea mexicana]|uniref:G/T mismatch-specific thymine DNA glycosylase-like n=1 Tax=Eufriesea mexicana TaxID=516756 RepID=UPI00083C5F44|nr:PREDICTED: G/T mismatch-specific thymine DNA glycosylase-like [Eufriesea mexicana]
MSLLTLNKLKKKISVKKIGESRKKINRFDGLTEEEVQKHTLPDYLDINLDIVFIGINPGLMAAYRGRYYAGPGNHFYKLLHESGLTSRCLTYEEDYKLLRYKIGLTNIVARATKSSADLKNIEIKEGSRIIEEKLKFYKPKIAVFNGKCIYKIFANKVDNFTFGLQPERINETAIWVTPSSSARCANFPRMTDKLHFFTSLKKYLQFLKGEIKNINIEEVLFEGKCKQFIPQTSKMWRRKNMSAFLHGGRIANKDTVCFDTSDENVAIARSTEFIVKKLQSNENDKIDKVLGTNEFDLSINFECISQDIKTFFENDESIQREYSQTVSDIQIGTNQTITNTSDKSKHYLNTEKGKSIKKFSQNSELVKSEDFENNTHIDFINLIKQRLVKK